MTTRYVAPGGNDSNAGTIGAPWLTLSGAATHVVASDTLLVRAGTFAPMYAKGLDGITISNYPGEAVTIQRTSVGTVVGLENCRNITLLRNASGGSVTTRSTVAGNGTSTGVLFYETGGGTPGFAVSGILMDGWVVEDIAGYGFQAKDATDVTVQNCDVRHNGMGIRFLRGTGTQYVQRCQVHHHDRMIVSDATAGNDNGGLGIAFDYTIGAIARWNDIYENHAASVDYGFDGGAVEFYGSANCTVEENNAWNNEGFLETGTSDGSAWPMVGNKIRHNTVWGQLSYDTSKNSGAGDTPGILVRAGANLLIAGNTFDVDSGQDVIRVQETVIAGRTSPITGLTIEDNILQSNHAATKVLVIEHAPMTTGGIVIDYNLLRNSTSGGATVASRGGTNYAGTALASWRTASGYSAHDVWNTDPLFTNRTARDYSLQASSPAKDAGVAITGTTTGYLGAAPDMGSHEYSVLPPPGGTPPAAPVITFPAADGPNYTGTVTISGTCVAGASIELFDGATSKGIYPAPSTTWTFTLSGVSSAAHSYTAKATDSTSTVSAASNTRVITVNTTAPTVVSVSPATHATGVSAAGNVVVTFSKAIDPLTVTTDSFAVKEAGVLIPAAISFSVGNTVATYDPTPTLDALTLFSVELTAAIRDVAGNRLAG